jgi:hypothetical protein
VVDSASNRNEYQEYFLGGKGSRCVGLTILSSSCMDGLEILEHQSNGTLWACNRPLPVPELYISNYNVQCINVQLCNYNMYCSKLHSRSYNMYWGKLHSSNYNVYCSTIHSRNLICIVVSYTHVIITWPVVSYTHAVIGQMN